MQPILEILARHLLQNEEGDTGETRIILPNRRAGLFLRHHLALHTPLVRWSPRILTISDFINEISALKPSEPVETLFTLHDIYRRVKEQPESLDEFYYWGEIMLNDFDELDKYLVDEKKLFRNIIDLKDIEEPLAGLQDDQIRFIRQFWEGFHEGRNTHEKEQFLEIWKLLPVLYQELRAVLVSRGEGYPGMLYREIAERIERKEIPPPATRTIIAGFNALNGCEKRIFRWLRQHGARFFWDYDHQYTMDPDHEAGRFMRENLELFPPAAELEAFRGMEMEKEVRIFELPNDVLQSRTLFSILDGKETGPLQACTDTAVVLCDEALLVSVLMSIPESMEEVNVTMGYPMKSTPVYSFVDALFRLQHNVRRDRDGTCRFYHKDVSALLLHPYMKNPTTGRIHPVLEQMAALNLIQLDQSLFQGELEKKIFRPVDDSLHLIHYLREIFNHVLGHLGMEGEKMLPELHREFVLQLLIHLNKLEILMQSRSDIPASIAERLFRKVLSGLRIPFEGEPLSGLQVMGILETRLLDFKHVVLLSMNEEVMPASHFRHSYVPYALRLGFGMPSREDMDAIYAYHFNRLLQRAEKIDLLFNSASEGVRSGEMSRYLYQIKYQKGIEVTRPGLEVAARQKDEVVVRHTPEIDQKLQRYTLASEDSKYLSPSAINTYIDCSLRFYLRYLAGIGETDEVMEEIDAPGFGTVIHEAIRRIYKEIAEKNRGIIGPADLDQISSSEHAEQVLTRVFREYHFKGRKNAVIEGRNIIFLQVMIRFLKKIIQTDRAVAPFALISAEKEYHRELEIRVKGILTGIRLGGKIDRVDRLGSSLRVIDYKTGDAKQGFAGLDTLFDGASGTRNRAAFQTLFYAWLVAGEHPAEQIIPGLYIMKDLYDKSFDPALVMGSHRKKKKIDSFSEMEEDFLGMVGKVLESIFDPGVPFVQTKNEAICRNCNFAAICSRNAIE
jgi:CRISPR/Cas system-associated exonuclease Cas4 (RecB family)